MTGPFIVTTKREAVPLRADFPNALPNGPDHVERVAVATLEEAQNAAYSAAYQITKPERSFLPLAKVREAITESGGTITLPDGTVIEVEQTTWVNLLPRKDDGWLDLAGFAANGDQLAQRRILDNAQEAAA